MATRTKANLLSYEQLLEMISAYQWIPERKCLRLALECDNDFREDLLQDPVFGCLNRFTAAIERQTQQGPLEPGKTVHILLLKLVSHYQLLQQIDSDSVVTEIDRLVQVIGVDLVMIGIGNGHTTALALLLRTRAPLEWNRFCDYIERQSWKVSIDQTISHSRPGAATGTCTESLRSNLRQGIPDDLEGAAELESRKSTGRGLAHAFESKEFVQCNNIATDNGLNREQEEEDLDSWTGAPASNATGGTQGGTHQWRFKKFGLR